MSERSHIADRRSKIAHAPLTRRFYRRDAVTVARALLGQRLVRVVDGRRLAGVIVEVEAYLGVLDAAAHTFGGRRTARNASMWGDGGHAYVYFTYGMHHCLNVVARTHEAPEAVLIRALEPVEGLDAMYRHRPAARRDTDLCSGPAKLCQALRIDRSLDGVDLVGDRARMAGDDTGAGLWIERQRARPVPASAVTAAPRVGIDYAGDWRDRPLRFYVRGNPHVSRPAKSA